MKKILFLFLGVILFLPFVFANTIEVPVDFATIQDAINNAINGDTINVAAGTYSETLNLQGKSLIINGAGVGNTIINASSLTGYAIQNFGNNSIISGFTLIGTPDDYGFKVSGVNNITLENIKVEDSYKTGVDLNGVNNTILTNIEVTNTTNGFGIDMIDSNNITLTDIVTSGNAWGGVSIQTNGYYYSGGSDNINFLGSFDVSEQNPLLLEQDPPCSASESATGSCPVGPYSNITNVQIPSKFNYVVYAFMGGLNYKQQFYQETLNNAKLLAQLLNFYPYSDILIYDVAEENYYVENGMLIQDAIDSASSGDTINVGNGTYNENINIDKSLTLQGVGLPTINGVTGTVVEISSDNVKIDGFIITNSGVLGRGIHSSDYSDLTITNNIITGIGNSNNDTVGRGIEVISFSTNVNNINISNNQINNITSGKSNGIVSGGTSASGISIGWKSGNLDITNLVIQNNVISNVSADITAWTRKLDDSGWESANRGYGAYGILIDHGTAGGQTRGAKILGNTISNLEGLWAHGVGLEGDTPNALVRGNVFNDIIDHKTPSDAVGVFFEANPNAASVVVENNVFSTSMGWGVAMHTDLVAAYPELIITATNNYWGACDGPGLLGSGSGSNVSTNITYAPWLGACVDDKIKTPSCVLETESNITLYANVSSNVCVGDVTFSVYQNGSWTNYTGDASNSGIGNYSYILNSNLFNGGENINWTVYADDCYNNTDKSSVENFYINYKTNLSVNPLTPQGDNGWYITTPLFTLTNPDTFQFWYQWDSVGIYNYTESFNLTNIPNPYPIEGAGTLELNYWSDLCGNETTQTKMFYVDLTNPEIVNLQPKNGEIVYNNLRPKISAYLDEVYGENSGIDNSSIIIKVDGIDVTSSANITSVDLDVNVSYIPTSDLNEGLHNVTINATDNSGRNSELNWSFEIDTTSIPTMEVYFPKSVVYDTRRTAFNVSILNGEVKTLKYINYNKRSPRWTMLCRNCDEYGLLREKTKNLMEGENNISIKATNAFGQSDEKNISFFIDSKDPKISRTNPTRGFANGEFEIQFKEENPESVFLNYGNSTELRNKEVNLSNCYLNKKKYYCNENVNLSDYDGQKIDYWFNITDIVGNTDESRHYNLDVDNSNPVINNPDSFFDVDGRYVYFSLNITEDNLDEVGYSYMDNRGRQKEKKLCSKLKNGLCEKRVSFKDGNHNLTVYIIDKVGNNNKTNISFFIDSKKPRISKTLPKRNSVTNGSNFYIKYTEANLKNITLSWNGSKVLTGCESGKNKECSTSVDLSDHDGEWIYYWFNVTDIVGNFGVSRITKVLVDTTSPELEINSPLNNTGNESYGKRVPFNVTINEEVTLEYSDNGDRFKKLCSRCDEYGESRSKTKSFSRGIHNVTIRAVDKAGNSDMKEINFEVNY